MTGSLPPALSEKEWCCLFDAVSGRAIGRTSVDALVWSIAPDGAVRHPAAVVDALVAWGALAPLARGRWSVGAQAASVLRLPVRGHEESEPRPSRG